MFPLDRHKTIIHCYELLSQRICAKYHLAHMEYKILMLLYNHPSCTTASDIVRYCKATKSHVSSSLKHLEQRGLIQRVYTADNKKSLKVVLLAPADQIIQEGRQIQRQFMDQILTGLSPNEKRFGMRAFHKICDNAEHYFKTAMEQAHEK